MKFSERIGKTTPRNVLQVDNIGADLSVSLWNLLIEKHVVPSPKELDLGLPGGPSREHLERIWSEHLHKPLESLGVHETQARQLMREVFDELAWFGVYDLIEFIAQTWPYGGNDFTVSCNVILAREGSGYRFVDDVLTPITNSEEIREIEAALSLRDKYALASQHLETALALMSHRVNPDIRNSIKESISAVESACSVVTHREKAQLKDALRQLESSGQLHPALKEAFTKLYGYTSDADGIRHALMGESNLTLDDARFMLVVCSAFVNYLKTRV